MEGLSPQEQAKAVGKAVAERPAPRIEAVVFDRGGYPYHGQIKALADGRAKAVSLSRQYGRITDGTS